MRRPSPPDTAHTRGWRSWLMLMGCAGFVACAPDDPGPLPDASPAETGVEAPDATTPDSPTPREGSNQDAVDVAPSEDDRSAHLWFTEEAAARGLTARNHCGAAPDDKVYLVETIGNGAALFDGDGDGDLDVLLVDGCTVVPPETEVDAPADQMPTATDDDWKPAFDGRTTWSVNDGHGVFEDATDASGIDYRGMGVGAAAADIHGDGHADVLITAWGPNRLFRGRGDGTFEDVSTPSGVADPRWSVGAAWLDADRDGFLDLFTANYFALTTARDPDVWRKVDCPHLTMEVACGPKGMDGEPDSFFLNRGDGTFEDRSATCGVRSMEPRYGLGAVGFDADLDGWMDVYVANDSRGNYLWRNLADWSDAAAATFEEWADPAGASLSAGGVPQAGMGIACGDYDADGDADLFLTNFSYDDNTLYRNDGMAFFRDITRRNGFGEASFFALGWGAGFADFDLDGQTDLFVANGHIFPQADERKPELNYRDLNRVFQNDGTRLNDVTEEAGPGLSVRQSTRGAAFGDVDQDGDIDVLLVEMNAPPSLLINQAHSATGALVLTLEGAGPNRNAIGARVALTLGERTQWRHVRAGHSFACTDDRRVHFGLGGAVGDAEVRVHWPDGTEQLVESVAAPGRYVLRQGAEPEEMR